MSALPATESLHLAQLQLNPRSREVREDLKDHGSLHRRVQALFPDELGPTPRAAARVLFRLERTQHTATLLIQSGIPINRNALPADYTDAPVAYRDLGPLLDWAQTGHAVQYRIDTTAIRALRPPAEPGQKRGRGTRTPLAGDDAIDWWEQQAAKAGLRTHLILDIAQPAVTARSSGGARAAYQTTRFEGTAAITDPAPLREALRNGIGQGRAFGLGLLSIAPYRG